MKMQEKIKTTVGVAVGIFNNNGELLLKRRKQIPSITKESYYGCWELPLIAVPETKEKKIPYNYLGLVVKREIKKRWGIDIFLDPIPALYPTMFKTPAGDYDLAMITVVEAMIMELPESIEIKWVSPSDLNLLAVKFVPAKMDKGKIIKNGEGLLSGKKRQFHMALKAIKVGSPFPEYRRTANEFLIREQI
ncbi:hypothetical protein KAR26_03105 [Candidatus Parcubacteria bacterium]|nr:hypothetical protein [Candidatus Parcubacteria bacterium]